MPKPIDRFSKLQTTVQDAEKAWRDLLLQLTGQYQHQSYAPAGKRTQLRKLRERADRHHRAFFEFLKTLSPRDWESGVPCSWIVNHLTYEDAITIGPLSVVPPPAYGYAARDSQRFAEGLK